MSLATFPDIFEHQEGFFSILNKIEYLNFKALQTEIFKKCFFGCNDYQPDIS
jgi:hypothetical protein